MIFDKLLLFAEGKSISASANSSVLSEVIDLRANGEAGIDGMLRIYGQAIGTVPAADASKVTTVLQTSADGWNWTDIASASQNGNTLIAMFLPCKGVKRFIRLKFSQGGTALSAAIKVKAGLVDQFDIDELGKVQSFPPLEDLLTVLYLDKGAIDLDRKTASTSTGIVVHVTNSVGTVTAAVTLSGSTSAHVTATPGSNGAWTIKSTSSITAADYKVTFTDAEGRKAVLTVHGSTASS